MLRARVTGVAVDGTAAQFYLGHGATVWLPIEPEDRDVYRRAVVLGYGCDVTFGPLGPERPVARQPTPCEEEPTDDGPDSRPPSDPDAARDDIPF